MTPFLQIVSGAHALPQLVRSLGQMIATIKSAQGKKDVATFRIEVIQALEQLEKIVAQESERIAALQEQNALLAQHVNYLSLPFYKRWFTPRPAEFEMTQLPELPAPVASNDDE